MISTSNLGQHHADFDEQNGSLTIYDEKSLMKLSADETYQLLVWLSDNYRDQLQQLIQQKGQGQFRSQRKDIEVQDAEARAREDYANDE